MFLWPSERTLNWLTDWNSVPHNQSVPHACRSSGLYESAADEAAAVNFSFCWSEENMAHTHLNSAHSLLINFQIWNSPRISFLSGSSLVPHHEALSHTCFISLSNICGHSLLPSFLLMMSALNNNWCCLINNLACSSKGFFFFFFSQTEEFLHYSGSAQ